MTQCVLIVTRLADDFKICGGYGSPDFMIGGAKDVMKKLKRRGETFDRVDLTRWKSQLVEVEVTNWPDDKPIPELRKLGDEFTKKGLNSYVITRP